LLRRLVRPHNFHFDFFFPVLAKIAKHTIAPSAKNVASTINAEATFACWNAKYVFAAARSIKMMPMTRKMYRIN
jgi:hypothetical protein